MARQRSKAGAVRKADQEFVSEAEEILERMRSGLVEVSEQRGSGREVDPDRVNALFRAAHSLKALAGMFGFDPILELAHHLEEVLDGLRLGRVPLESPAVGLIEESVRLFATLLERIGDADAIAALDDPIDDLSQRIEILAKTPPGSDDAFEGLDLDTSLLRALTEYEEHRLRENVQRGRHIALVESTFEIISFEEGLSALSEAIRQYCEVLSTLPAPGETPESQIRFSLLVASDLAADTLTARLDFPDASVRSVLRAPSPAEAPEPALSVSAPAVRDAIPETSGSEVTRESLKSISETVRVDIRKLDELMNLVGDLVIQRGAIGDVAARLLADPQTTRVGTELSKIHKDLDRRLKGLQSAVLDVRMVPLRQVFDKVSRVVRTLRRDLNKDVRLEVRGADTELDKLIVEELVDPLMHIVRNSLDHAIEPLEERLAAGKEPEGRIEIHAFQRGNHVVISVADDGAGIDAERLRKSAEASGLVQRGEVLSAKETLDLIFAPGISTRDEVTETSGRGVGMDVVRSNLTALGGVVDVESVPGRGTTISMTLPITLAIIQSLIVGAGRQRFAIPLNAVLETLLIDPVEIQRSEGREILNLRGDALTLRRLSVEFGLEAPASDAKQFVVVLGMGDARAGLLVDRLEGQQDTVIKSIQGPIRTLRGIAGATDLGDQEPVLVLDASSLLEEGVRRRDAS